MLRRDLLATLLSVLSGIAVDPLLEKFDAVATAVRDEPDDSDDPEPPDGTRTAVVDRVEGDTAVVLFEDGSGTTVLAAVLPADARESGTVLRVPQGDSLALATVDRAATARRRRQAAERFDDLAERAPGDGAATENGTEP